MENHASNENITVQQCVRVTVETIRRRQDHGVPGGLDTVVPVF